MSTRPLVILMADDDPDDRLLAEEALREARVVNDLRFVEDGEQLMDYLHRRGRWADPEASPWPGLVLLDLNMPRMDGRGALERIKADPALRRLPVGGGAHHLARQGGRAAQLRPGRKLLHRQARDLRGAGGRHGDAGPLLGGNR